MTIGIHFFLIPYAFGLLPFKGQAAGQYLGASIQRLNKRSLEKDIDRDALPLLA